MLEEIILVLIVCAIIWVFHKYSSTDIVHSFTPARNFFVIGDKYTTYDEVQDALRKAGLEASNLIVGIDYTRSNEYTGKISFKGRNLHSLGDTNPYQQAIYIIGKTLESFDEDKLIPCYGFGDITTTDKKVFPFHNDKICYGFNEVLERYTEITPTIVMSGPTSFAPIIREAIKIVKREKSYHILVIIADGQVTSELDTKKAIVEAADYSLSILVVGVGDGPWEMMKEFDDGLPERAFDNFQFVNFNDFFNCKMVRDNPELDFAVAALQEIPDQFKEIRRLGLL